MNEILISPLEFVNVENSVPYPLNPEFRFREPGDDDGPVLPPSDPAWFENDPWEKTSPVQIALNYLDSNAQVGGYGKKEQIQELTDRAKEGEVARPDLKHEINGELARAKICLKTAAHFHGSETMDLYHHVLNCRKPWCEICGGKQGVISKTRKKAVRKRIDVKEYGIRQLVFTVPEAIRESLQSRKNINKLFRDAQQVSAKYCGDSTRAKRNPDGSIDRHSFGDNLAIGYAHLFGDPDKKGKYRSGNAGSYHPHINVHIFEKSDDLHLPAETLEKMRGDWKKKLSKYGKFEGEVDIHYSYVRQSAKERKKYHKIKYMVKPYLKENIDRVIQDDNLELLKLLTIDLKGFQFLRFWGGLSNVKKQYREEAGIYPDDIDEIEKRIQEKLIFQSVKDFNLQSYLKEDLKMVAEGKPAKLKKLGENFYRERIGHEKERFTETGEASG